ncbi:TonB-dependent receptor plug domain-containing protein [Elusimicrobiota bacterium]
MIKKTINLVLMLFISINAYGGSGYLGDLGTIVVTPTRSGVKLSDLGTNIEIVTGEYIVERGLKTAAAALEGVLGISGISERGTRGSTRDIRMRSGGDTAKQVLIMIDNQPVNDTALGAGDLEEISADYIDRIEIVRGPGSAVWGANAIGGVINILTKTPEDLDSSLEVHTDINSLYSQKYSLVLNHYETGSGVYASASCEDSDGWRKNSQYTGRNFLVKVTKDHPVLGQLKTQVAVHESEFGIPGQNSTAIEDYDGDVEKIAQSPNAVMEKLNQYLQIELKNNLNNSILLTSRLYSNILNKTYVDPDAFTNDKSDTLLYGIDVQAEIKDIATAGVEMTVNNFVRKDQTMDSVVKDIDEDTINSALFLQKTLDLAAVNIILGLRYDMHTVYENQLNPNITVVYKLNENTKFSLNAGKAFRAPTFEDLYSPYTSWPAFGFFNAGDTQGNPDIKPETAWGYDIGMEQSLGSFLLGRLTLFRSDIENLIEWTEIDPDLAYDKWRPSNVGEAFNQGVEAGIDLELLKDLEQGINFTYLQSKGKKYK